MKTIVSTSNAVLCILFLSAACLVGFVTEKAFADATAEVYVGGVGMNSGDYLAVGSSATTAIKPADNYAHYANGVLTLHNYNYDGEGYEYTEDWSTGVYSERDLEIVLEGSNALETTTACGAEGISMYEGASLSISGNGSLHIAPVDISDSYITYGAYIDGDGGTFTLEGGELVIDAGLGIYADSGIEVNGGKIAVDTYFEGFETYGNIVINDGDITVSAYRDAVYAGDDFVVSGGALSVKSFDTEEDDKWWAVAVGGAFSIADGMTVQVSTEPDGELVDYAEADHDSYDWILVEGVPDSSLDFVDVPEGSWFYNPVAWAVSNGITAGTSATTFGPDATCTRAQIVTFLWKSEGKPAPAVGTTAFVDVLADAWYRTSVLWAVENGVTSGTSATTFSPDSNCTRAQIVTFMYKYMAA